MTLKDQTKLLSARGIGKRYHKMSLADFSHEKAKEVVAWIDKGEYKNGQGILIQGMASVQYDLAILAARGLILSDLPKLEVRHFQDLCDVNEFNYETKVPLLITNFEAYEHACHSLEYKKLEAYLNSLLDDDIPILIHAPLSLEHNYYMSVTFINRITEKNITF